MFRREIVTISEVTIDRALSGDQRALSRLATRLENDPARAAAIVEQIYPRTGRAHVIGVTGAPGVGKSTVLAGLAAEVSRQSRRIAIIAVDPTSPRSGGATLGDRIRMTETALDPNVFVRSIASRHRHDGLAPAVADLSLLFDAAEYDIIAIETVGSGQDQLEIADLVHTTVLVQIPGTGDSVQLLKAGAMEIADIYVVNKADLPGAQRVSRDLRSILSLGAHGDVSWDSPIVLTSGIEKLGFDALLGAIDRHWQFLRENGSIDERRRRIARSELRRALARQVEVDESNENVSGLLDAVVDRTLSPEDAARAIIRSMAASYEDL
jgi:LAO/AO transport system kinase